MPYLNLGGQSIRLACSSCIRGHRATLCQHLNCPLIEVKRPGRPNVNHVSLPLKSHPCRDGMARTWTVKDTKELDSDAFKQNAKDHTFQIGEMTAAAPQQYPKAKPKKTSIRRKTLQSIDGNSPLEAVPDHTTTVFQVEPPSYMSSQQPSCCSSTRTPQSNTPSLSSPVSSSSPSSKTTDTSTGIEDQKLPSIQHPVEHSRELLDLSHQPHVHYHNASFNLSTSHSNGLAPDYSTPTTESPSEYCSPRSILTSSIAPSPPLDDFPSFSTIFDHEYNSTCICGTSCDCLGCPQHPHNPRTVRHVNELSQYMATDPLYNPEGYLAARRTIRQRLLLIRPELIHLDEETDWTQIAQTVQESPIDFDSSDASLLSEPLNLSQFGQFGVEHSYQALFHDSLLGNASIDQDDERIVGQGGILDNFHSSFPVDQSIAVTSPPSYHQTIHARHEGTSNQTQGSCCGQDVNGT